MGKTKTGYRCHCSCSQCRDGNSLNHCGFGDTCKPIPMSVTDNILADEENRQRCHCSCDVCRDSDGGHCGFGEACLDRWVR